MVKAYGSEFKRTLVYDRIKEDLRIFCANNTIDDVYNVKFLDIVEQVKDNVKTSISRLGEVVIFSKTLWTQNTVPRKICDLKISLGRN